MYCVRYLISWTVLHLVPGPWVQLDPHDSQGAAMATLFISRNISIEYILASGYREISTLTASPLNTLPVECLALAHCPHVCPYATGKVVNWFRAGPPCPRRSRARACPGLISEFLVEKETSWVKSNLSLKYQSPEYCSRNSPTLGLESQYSSRRYYA